MSSILLNINIKIDIPQSKWKKSNKDVLAILRLQDNPILLESEIHNRGLEFRDIVLKSRYSGYPEVLGYPLSNIPFIFFATKDSWNNICDNIEPTESIKIFTVCENCECCILEWIDNEILKYESFPTFDKSSDISINLTLKGQEDFDLLISQFSKYFLKQS